MPDMAAPIHTHAQALPPRSSAQDSRKTSGSNLSNKLTFEKLKLTKSTRFREIDVIENQQTPAKEEIPECESILPLLSVLDDWLAAGTDFGEQDYPVERTPGRNIVVNTLNSDDNKTTNGTIQHSDTIPRARTPSSLANFRRYDSSTTGDPTKWLKESYNHLLNHLAQSKSDRVVRKGCSDFVFSSMPFARFAIYLYDTTDDLEALRAVVAICEECDILKALCRFRETMVGLRRCFNKEFAHTDHEVTTKILALDVDVICARLYGLVKNEEQYRRLVNLQESEAHLLLDLMQKLLDIPSLDRIFRGPFLNAMLRLSRQSKLFPESLWQEQVSIEGNEALTAGTFGEVWKGVYRGQDVAVKVLRVYQKSDLDDHKKKVIQETLIWRQLQHVNVLPFLCLHHVNNNERRIGLVSPWMKNGNMKEFLHRSRDVDRIALVADIAEGLNYLHNLGPKIIHGDLKAVNILISDLHRACIADFGLSTVSESQVIRLAMFSPIVSGGTTRWTAPELLKGSEKVSNVQTDVYSFAVVCYEIFSCGIPFADLDPYPIMLAVIEGQRPTRPRQCEHWKTPCLETGLDDKLWALVERCWDADPTRRPSMNAVLQELPPRQHHTPATAVDYQHFKTSSEGLWDLITTV
ncbi:hypothetical protein DXG01_002744 [Tephrocybe rancida]|nr:hypothetical protein DXG01_002744 [Tephrocybe rancida]